MDLKVSFLKSSVDLKVSFLRQNEVQNGLPQACKCYIQVYRSDKQCVYREVCVTNKYAIQDSKKTIYNFNKNDSKAMKVILIIYSTFIL